MVRHYKFGHKMPRKTWKYSEIDTELENKKLALVLLSPLTDSGFKYLDRYRMIKGFISDFNL